MSCGCGPIIEDSAKRLKELGLKKVYTIEGRRTMRGALTTFEIIKIEKGVIWTRKTAFSRSKLHWREELWVSEDAQGWVKVVDISNTGKDRSYILRIENGKVKWYGWANRVKLPL